MKKINLRKYTSLKELLYDYRHAWVLLYFFLYMAWFFYLEGAVTTTYTSIHIFLDDHIPFCEWFVIPYYLWFGYIFITVAYFFFTRQRKEFYQCTAFLFIGMSICLLIYTIWPNGQDLRPNLDSLGRDNVLIDIMRNLYTFDTPTNVCPSIHAYNSIGVTIAILKNKRLRKISWIKYGNVILTTLICLSTCFLKQHSSFDVIAAILLSVIMYVAVYLPNWSFGKEKSTESVNFS